MPKRTLEEVDSLVTKARKAVGNCPECGRLVTWFNDVPLRAFCWGTEKNPHKEFSCVVPGKAQPYGRGPRKAVWKQT